MNCERIKDLILTDYSDGQISAQGRKQVEDHTAHCASCRSLAQRVLKESVAPFQQLTPARCDDFVWQRIKQKLQEPQPPPAGVGVLDILGNFLYPFRPLAIAASLVFLLAIAPMMYSNFTPQQSYLTYVMETDSGSDDITAGVEQYFL